MKHYVQYHNTDKQGGSPPSGEPFQIFAKKSIRHLPGQRVWLISGEGATPKRFYLEYTFQVDEIQDGAPNRALGSTGTRISPRALLNSLDWFQTFKAGQQNFSLGLREIDDQTVAELEKLARAVPA